MGRPSHRGRPWRCRCDESLRRPGCGRPRGHQVALPCRGAHPPQPRCSAALVHRVGSLILGIACQSNGSLEASAYERSCTSDPDCVTVAVGTAVQAAARDAKAPRSTRGDACRVGALSCCRAGRRLYSACASPQVVHRYRANGPQRPTSRLTSNRAPHWKAPALPTGSVRWGVRREDHGAAGARPNNRCYDIETRPPRSLFRP